MTPRPTALLSILALAAAGFAQDAPPQPPGLAALDDGRVLTELAGRGLEDLLRHALDAQGVPEDERNPLLANIALARLTGGEAISATERRELVLDLVRNVDELVADEVDPSQAGTRAGLLMQQAQVLIDQGVGEEVRLLEYFGDNPDRRRYVRPVAEAVATMLTRAGELFGDEADRLEDLISSPDDRRIEQAKELRQQAQQAGQLALFADYYRLLAMDPDDTARIDLGDRLTDRVKPLDTDRNPSRAFVQQFLGKLSLARGGEIGRDRARDYFEAAIASGANGPAQQLFDSYFGRTIVEAEARQPEVAMEQLSRFEGWFEGVAGELEPLQPLMLVAKFRVADAASRSGVSSDARAAADARARQLLTQLVDTYESYRPVVTQQLLARVDAETDLGELSPLVLDALVDRGRAEAARLAESEGDANAPAADRELIERAIAAAGELVRRGGGGSGEIDATILARAGYLRGLMLQLLDRPAEAAEAYLAFGEMAAAKPEQRLSAYRRTLGIVDALRADGSAGGDAAVRADEIEAALLPVLVDEFGDTTRAFDLANRLHRTGELERAIDYYRKVPDDDPRKPDARYLVVIAQSQRLAELPEGDAKRAALLADLPGLGEAALADLESRPEAAYRERAVRLRLTLARLALVEREEPEEALALLSDIERRAAEVEGGESIVEQALPLRFQATAAAGQIDEATADLLRLLDSSDAQRGLAFISQFRETLNRAYERASVRGDRAAMARVMQTRAAVTPKLVEWIEQSNDPAYRRYVYNFRRFNAETQLQAALLTDDPAERRRRLEGARNTFADLESPDNLRQYRGLLEGLSYAQRQQVPYDREVVLNLGRVAYELEDWAEARSRFARLLADRSLGGPTVVEDRDGVAVQVPNDDFWETQLKFVRSSLANGVGEEQMARHLRQLRVIHGNALGGRRWQREFAALSGELLGEDAA